jgi:glycosyltransferase involved in cell wall biosynthesis
MRIVIVLDTVHVNGGQAKVAIDSAIALKARGHQPVVFGAVGPVAPELLAAGIETHCLDQPELTKDASKTSAIFRGLHNAVAAEALGILLKAQPAGETIIHVHAWAKALSSAIATPIAASGFPAVYTMHEYFLVCPNGGFFNYRINTHCPLDPLSLQCLATQCDTGSYIHKGWRTTRLAIARYIHHLPQTLRDVVYFHPFQRAIIERHLPGATRLHEIANPIDVLPLGEKTNPAAGDILYLGRIAVEKGVMLYAEAARRAGMAPVFVGDGPAVPEIAARYPETRFLGWHDPAGVRQKLREARALVFPSLWYEGQPLTVLEALALGTPVIAGDGNAGRESVIDGETGLWFRQGDVEDLARTLRAMQDDDRVCAMSCAAYRRYWADPLTLERHCGKLETLYTSLLDASFLAA